MNKLIASLQSQKQFAIVGKAHQVQLIIWLVNTIELVETTEFWTTYLHAVRN